MGETKREQQLLERYREESKAFQAVGRAFDAMVPLSVSEDLAVLREERGKRDLLRMEVKEYAFHTHIKGGDVSFDPTKVVLEFLALRESLETA